MQTIRPDGSDRRTGARLPGAVINHLTWSRDFHDLAFTAARQPPQS